MSNLERNLRIDDLAVGDIVAPEGRYITSDGDYYTAGSAFAVVRIDPKSVSLRAIRCDELDACKWDEYEKCTWQLKERVRIFRKSTIVGYHGEEEGEPLFARDNTRLPEIRKKFIY